MKTFGIALLLSATQAQSDYSLQALLQNSMEYPNHTPYNPRAHGSFHNQAAPVDSQKQSFPASEMAQPQSPADPAPKRTRKVAQPVVLGGSKPQTPQTPQPQTQPTQPQAPTQAPATTQPYQPKPPASAQPGYQPLPEVHIPGQHPEGQYGQPKETQPQQKSQTQAQTQPQPSSPAQPAQSQPQSQPQILPPTYSQTKPDPAPMSLYQMPQKPQDSVPKSLQALVGYQDRPVASYSDPYYHGPDIGFQTTIGDTTGPPALPGYDYFQDYPTAGGDAPKMFGQMYAGPFNPYGMGGGVGFTPPPQVTRKYSQPVAGRDYGYGVVQQPQRPTVQQKPMQQQPAQQPAKPEPAHIPGQHPEPQYASAQKQTQPTQAQPSQTQAKTAQPVPATPTTTTQPPAPKPTASTSAPPTQPAQPTPATDAPQQTPQTQPIPASHPLGYASFARQDYPGTQMGAPQIMAMAPQATIMPSYAPPPSPPGLYNPYGPPYYGGFGVGGKYEKKLAKQYKKAAMNPYGPLDIKAKKQFDIDMTDLKHYYDGGQHTGLTKSFMSPGFHNDMPTSSGMMMNGIPLQQTEQNQNEMADQNEMEDNEFRLTGREFITLDWGPDGKIIEADEDNDDDDDDEDEDTKSEISEESPDEEKDDKDEDESFDEETSEEEEPVDEDSSEDTSDEEDALDDEDEYEQTKSKARAAAMKMRRDFDLKRKQKSSKKSKKGGKDQEDEKSGKKKKSKGKKKKKSKNEDSISEDVISEVSEEPIRKDDFHFEEPILRYDQRFEEPDLREREFEEPMIAEPIVFGKKPVFGMDPTDPGDDDISDPWMWNDIPQAETQNQAQNALLDRFNERKSGKNNLQDRFNQRKGRTNDDDFYSHHYGGHRFEQPDHYQERDYHHEELEWPGDSYYHHNPSHTEYDHHSPSHAEYDHFRQSHEQVTYDDKPWMHHYDETHQEIKEREFFEKTHGTPPTLPLDVKSGHHGEVHEAPHHHYDPDYHLVAEPSSKFDFVKLKDIHAVHPEVSPHDKVYDKHFKSWDHDYHQQAHLPSQDPLSHEWQGDFVHNIEMDVDLYEKRAMDDSHAYWQDHYYDQHDIDHFSGERPQTRYHQGADDEDYHLKLAQHHYDSPRRHHPEVYEHKLYEEHRPADSDFSHFDWHAYQEHEEAEHKRRIELERIMEKERKYEAEEKARKQKEEDDKKKAEHAKQVAKEAEEADRQAKLAAQKAKEAREQAKKAADAAEAAKKRKHDAEKKHLEPVHKDVHHPSAAPLKAPAPVKTQPVVKKQAAPAKKGTSQKQDGIPSYYHDWEDELPVYPDEHHIFWDVGQKYTVLYDPHYSSVYDQEYMLRKRFSGDTKEHDDFYEHHDDNFAHTDRFYTDHYDHDYHHLSHPKQHYWEHGNGETDPYHYDYEHEVEYALLSGDYHEHNDHHFENGQSQLHHTRSQDEEGYDHEMELALLGGDYHDVHHDLINDHPYYSRPASELERLLGNRVWEDDNAPQLPSPLKNRRGRRNDLDHLHEDAHWVEGSDSHHVEVAPLIEESYHELEHDLLADDDFYHNNGNRDFDTHSYFIEGRDLDHQQIVPAMQHAYGTTFHPAETANETPLYVRPHIEDPIFLQPEFDTGDVAEISATAHHADYHGLSSHFVQ